MIIIFGGLPGSGKTIIAKLLAEKLKGVYIRIDTIEQALIRDGMAEKDMKARGCEVGYALAAENLQLNLTVVADSVNPLSTTREAWRSIGLKSMTQVLEVEIVCSNQDEHRNRIKSRIPDISNHKLPSWDDVLRREYEPWSEAHLIIDTGIISPYEAVNKILSQLKF